MEKQEKLLYIKCQLSACGYDWSEKYNLPAGALFCPKCRHHTGRPIKILKENKE